MAALSGFQKIILSSIFFINLFPHFHHTSAQLIPNSCNNKIGNYTKNTNFQANLNTILSSITSKINSYGFYNNTVGDDDDQVNAIAYCRGDIDIEPCRSCVNDAARNLTVLCPNQKEAVVWFDECMFTYSNKSIFGHVALGPAFVLENANNASNVDLFSQELRKFAGILVDQAYNGTFRKYAGMKSSDPNGQSIYGTMQCTPDLKPSDCRSCLDDMENYLSSCCYNRVGARIGSPSCTFRYETYPFLNKLSSQPLPPSLAPLSPSSPLLPPLSPSSSPLLPPSSAPPPPPLSPSSSPLLPPSSTPPPRLSPSSSSPPPLPQSSPPPPPPVSPSSPPPLPPFSFLVPSIFLLSQKSSFVFFLLTSFYSLTIYFCYT